MTLLHRLSHAFGMNRGWPTVVTGRSGTNWVAFVCSECGRVSHKSQSFSVVCRTADEPPDHAFRLSLAPLVIPNPDA